MLELLRKRVDEDDQGFTLIELLVVVIIIGILAAIAIPTFLSQRERGWQAEVTSTTRNVALEVEAAATAASGVYTVVDQDAVNGFVDTIQGDDGPVSVALTEVYATGFCLTGTHELLTDGEYVLYDTQAGGVQPFTTGACTAAP